MRHYKYLAYIFIFQINILGLYNTQAQQVSFEDPPSPNSFLEKNNDSIDSNKTRKHLDSHIPQIMITSVKINGKDTISNLSHMKVLELPFAYRYLIFEFIALNLNSPAQNQYAFMMEGMDEQWIYTNANKRYAVYANLAPGEYIFRVKGSDNNGTWNEQGCSLKILIHPPFWKKGWIYFLYSIIIALAVYNIIIYIKDKAKLKHTLEVECLKLEKMQEIDRLKNHFFANISHEFRTPLTLILGPLAKLLASEEISPDVKQRLKLMNRNGKRLLRMTQQIMNLHKIETGNLKFNLLQTDIIKFIQEMTVPFKDIAEQYQIMFQFDSKTESLQAWMDPEKLEDIIYNLLSNAFKFTPPQGSISIHLSFKGKTVSHSSLSTPSYIEIRVQDSGVGIPANKIQHIFDRFYQVENSHYREYSGSGIGLAITYELIQLYHGTISVKSEEGSGSLFTVCLPLNKDDITGHQSVSTIHSISGVNDFDNTTKISPLKNSFIVERKANASNSRQTKSNPGKDAPLILIIEDNIDMCAYIKQELAPHYQIITANNGIEGLRKALEIIPDLILSDIMMPEMDGIQLCHKLKTDQRSSHIPIIMLTARSSSKSQIKGLQAGADDYIIKPFHSQILLARIKNLLDSRQKLANRFQLKKLLKPKNITLVTLNEQFLKHTLQVLEYHISDHNFTIEQLSKKVGMSRAQLFRKIKALTGLTVNRFIRDFRLERAAQLLRQDPQLRIAEVAERVGFKDQFHFSTSFREKYNQSPKQFQHLSKK